MDDVVTFRVGEERTGLDGVLVVFVIFFLF